MKRFYALALLLAVLPGFAQAPAKPVPKQPASGPDLLQAKYVELKKPLAESPFGKPLHLVSTEGSDRLAGDIHAVLAHPFPVAAPALARPENWCEILLLVINIKQCRTKGDALTLHVGSKNDQPVEQAHTLDFTYVVAVEAGNFLQVRMDAAQGPLSTRDYRIVLEAIPLPDNKTFIHLGYSYGYGLQGKLAMKAYLNTFGADKVGFTVVSKGTGGEPQYVGGMRGVAERNTMRYFLAIESYLGALPAPPQQRREKAMRDWFRATEVYAQQLHEMKEDEYLRIKAKEFGGTA